MCPCRGSAAAAAPFAGVLIRSGTAELGHDGPTRACRAGSGAGEVPRSARVWVHIAVAALFANAMPYLLFAVAEQIVNSSTAGIINATTPLWTVALTLAVRHQKTVTSWQAVAAGSPESKPVQTRVCRSLASRVQRTSGGCCRSDKSSVDRFLLPQHPVAQRGDGIRVAELECLEPLCGQAGAVSDSWAHQCPAIPPGACNWGWPGSGDRDLAVPGGLVVQKWAG